MGSAARTFDGSRDDPRAVNVHPVTGVQEGRRKIGGPMSPRSIGRHCAGAAIVLVLLVAAASPATAQTHANVIQTHA
jgi:hypothetical protein